MGTTSEEITKMNTKGSNVSSSFAGNPEDGHVSLLIVLDEFALIDGSDSEFLLDSGDKWWSLETGTSESLESFLNFLNFIDFRMEFDNGDIFFTS
jgi:hypothetical protein